MAVNAVIILLSGCIELFIVPTYTVGSFIPDFFHYSYSNNEYFIEGVPVQSGDPSQNSHPNYSVFCGNGAIKIVLLSGPLPEVNVLDATKECGYSLIKENGADVLHVSFSSCHITVEEGRYTLQLLYHNSLGLAEVATEFCDGSSDMTLQKHRIPCSNDQTDCSPAPRPSMTPDRRLPQIYTRAGCDIPTDQRLPCGSSETTDCLSSGCCMDVTGSCYYSMDQCTADGQFVFTIYSNVTTIPVSTRSLHIAAKEPCNPVLATNEYATFKFSRTECGTKTYSIGDTTVYMAEVRTAIRTLNLKYGTITRDHPVRLMVECRYSKISPTIMKATAGYMVVSPSVPASVSASGLFSVQLRLANDESFTSFAEHGNLPLKVLLGKPLYLEVRLNSPNPAATLLVNYCVAYTRSARNALVLLYEGCPDPYLASVQSSFLRVQDLPQTPHQRRFVVTAFQFMNVTTQKYINEEIYFMCSTEVCMSSETPCRKTCFDGKA